MITMMIMIPGQILLKGLMEQILKNMIPMVTEKVTVRKELLIQTMMEL